MPSIARGVQAVARFRTAGALRTLDVFGLSPRRGSILLRTLGLGTSFRADSHIVLSVRRLWVFGRFAESFFVDLP